MIDSYFAEIETTILFFHQIIKSYSIEKKIINENQGFIQGSILFNNNCKLNFIEVKDIDIENKDKYSYHFMDKNDNLIFRYDNAKHHPEINTFPHHKHLKDKIIESTEPELFDILVEIESKADL